MNILTEIIAHKIQEVAANKSSRSIRQLEASPFFQAPVISLAEFVQRADKSGIIAEFKRKSPSRGMINAQADVVTTTRGYSEAGASALSILTDKQYFGGSSEDLMAARQVNSCPILRKDFIVDEYQIIEAKSMGADAILLIAAALEPSVLSALARVAHSLGLEVLLEVHSKQELEATASVEADLIGVNNRDLKTFITNLDLSRQLVESIPDSVVKVSESGIENPKTILELRRLGYQGFLMGQNFMQQERPDLACREFIAEVRKLEHA